LDLGKEEPLGYFTLKFMINFKDLYKQGGDHEVLGMDSFGEYTQLTGIKWLG
jgi:hypothetical protein